MAESTWMAFTLHFVTNDERVILKVPADKDMKAHNAGAGYLVSDLETALIATDPTTFKTFSHRQCHDPLAKRVLLSH